MASENDATRAIFGDSDSEEDFEGFETATQRDNRSLSPVSSVHTSDLSDFESESESENTGSNAASTRLGCDLSSAYDRPWLMDFTARFGPLLHNDESTACEIFSHIFIEDFLNCLVTETNRFAAESIANAVLGPHARANKWTDVTNGDMQAFLALILIMGLVKMPSYEDYWTTDNILEMPGLRSTMTRNRFELILSYLHLNNNANNLPSDNPSHDRLFKVRPLLDHLNTTWKTAYHPNCEVSVDESVVAFKGRTIMSVYKPNKPHKWGLNAWALSDARTGYMWNVEMYTGRKAEVEPGMTKKVVLRLCQPLYNTGHHVYMDNYFSSPSLFVELKTNQLGACGTLRTNRVGVPAKIKKTKLKKEGPAVTERDSDGLLYISWFDRKQVNLISSIHNTMTFRKTVRTKSTAGHMREVDKPAAIELYSRYMQGVDRSDQLLWYNLSRHRQQKWWKKLFVYLLEVSVINAGVIYRQLHPTLKFDPTKFRMSIVRGLLADYERPISRVGRKMSQPPPVQLVERHFLANVTITTSSGKPSRPDCEVCSNRSVKRHQVQTMCKQCKLPMCAVPCFERYHTLLDYKAKCTAEYHA